MRVGRWGGTVSVALSVVTAAVVGTPAGGGQGAEWCPRAGCL